MKKKHAAWLSAVVFAGGLSISVLAPREAHAEEMTITGTISKIDRATGKVEVVTEKGLALIYFAPAAVKDLTEGDQVALALATATRAKKALV